MRIEMKKSYRLLIDLSEGPESGESDKMITPPRVMSFGFENSDIMLEPLLSAEGRIIS